MPSPVELKPIKTQDVIVPIIGIQSLICHAFSEQNIEAIESKQQKRATRAKPARDPDHEAEASLYRTVEGAYGFPAIGFRQAMISACRYVDDLPMTVARGAFFVLGDASGMVKLELPSTPEGQAAMVAPAIPIIGELLRQYDKRMAEERAKESVA